MYLFLAKDACTVWCHKEKGGTKSRGWSFPDGTTCKMNKDKESTYCIGGYCKVNYQYNDYYSNKYIFIIYTINNYHYHSL